MSTSADEAGHDADQPFPFDPMVEAYKRDIDRELIRENLRLSHEERLLNLMRLQRVAEELQRAGRRARREAGDTLSVAHTASPRSPEMDPEKPSIDDLTPAEKLQLVEDLWDDLAATPDTVPVQEWHKAELDRRKANLLKTPASALSWDEVKRRIRGRHGR